MRKIPIVVSSILSYTKPNKSKSYIRVKIELDKKYNF